LRMAFRCSWPIARNCNHTCKYHYTNLQQQGVFPKSVKLYKKGILKVQHFIQNVTGIWADISYITEVVYGLTLLHIYHTIVIIIHNYTYFFIPLNSLCWISRHISTDQWAMIAQSNTNYRLTDRGSLPSRWFRLHCWAQQ
jgi:hypothetical protein